MDGYLTTSDLAFVIHQAKRYLKHDRSRDHTDLQQLHLDMKMGHQLLMDTLEGLLVDMAEAAMPNWDGSEMPFLLKSSREEDINECINNAKMGTKADVAGMLKITL